MNPRDLPSTPFEGTAGVDATVLRAGAAPQATHERVADEVPVAIELNGITQGVMLATPLDLEDFAWGFLLGEGLIDAAGDLLDVESEAGPDGIVLQLRVRAQSEVRAKERRRLLAGRTGCGLCGSASLEQVRQLRECPRVPPEAAAGVTAAALQQAMRQLAETQSLQRLTGAVHAAAWCDLGGRVLGTREDVGRHNALDKLVGALARGRVDTSAGFAVVTSRASFEMAQKAARAGIGLLAAVSAPTRLAIELADQAGLTLAGFVRADRATVYTHAHRLDAAPRTP